MAMTSPRLLLAAGSIAATLAGIVPVLSHDATTGKPLQVGPRGVAVAVQGLAAGKAADATVVVPAGAKALSGTAQGSPALAARSRLTVTRSSDGATLFSGSLATFHSLAVTPGSALVVRVQKPAGYGGLRAGTQLSFS
jgi:hypothetical protein